MKKRKPIEDDDKMWIEGNVISRKKYERQKQDLMEKSTELKALSSRDLNKMDTTTLKTVIIQREQIIIEQNHKIADLTLQMARDDFQLKRLKALKNNELPKLLDDYEHEISKLRQKNSHMELHLKKLRKYEESMLKEEIEQINNEQKNLSKSVEERHN